MAEVVLRATDVVKEYPSRRGPAVRALRGVSVVRRAHVGARRLGPGRVMNLLSRLQDQLALSYVFISHDLAMVRHISDTISVMYLGKVVESGPYEAVLGAPLHPYTRALAEAVPLPDPEIEAGRRKAATGEVLSLGTEPLSRCPYHPRCPLAESVCRAQVPDLVELRPGHEVACHVAAREASVGTVAARPG